MIWWIIGAYVAVGFIASFIWHAYVVTRESEKFDADAQEISSMDDIGEYQKDSITEHCLDRAQSKVNRKPGWLIILAPWLIFTSRLD